jgi:hypothetical protein
MTVSDVACTTVDCPCHACNPQRSPAISVTNRCQSFDPGSYIAFPPHEVTAKGTPKPYIPPAGAGSNNSSAQEPPDHGRSQAHVPLVHLPFNEQSMSVAQNPAGVGGGGGVGGGVPMVYDNQSEFGTTDAPPSANVCQSCLPPVVVLQSKE